MKQTVFPPAFDKNYQTHLKRLTLNGMQPKTIEAYAHGVRRAGAYFDYQIDGWARVSSNICSSDGKLAGAGGGGTLSRPLEAMRRIIESALISR